MLPTAVIGQQPGLPADTDPVFQPFTVTPAQFAVLTIGGSTAPSVGPLQFCDMLFAGEHPWIGAWELYEPPLSPREQSAFAAATVVLNGCVDLGPLTQPLLLRRGESAGCWRLIDPNKVRPIPPRLLSAIRDGRLISSKSNDGREFEAFLSTIRQAHETSPAAFRKAARTDVAFANLFHNPRTYRGEVVHIEGRLRLIQRDDAQVMLKLAGISDLYFAWVFDELSGDNPYCILITHLPPGLPINRKINQPVTFDGYFYMNRTYKAEDSKKPNEFRVAPMLIGPTLALPPEEAAIAEKSTGWPTDMLTMILVLIVMAVALIAGLGYWFRWSDARIRRRVSATRRFEEPQGTEDVPDESLKW